LASIPSKTPEERQVRDRKAFILHSLFVDVAVFKAVDAIKRAVDSCQSSCKLLNESGDLVVCEEQVGDLIIVVRRDAADASSKSEIKLDGSHVLGMSVGELARRNLLKGITADESATVHVRILHSFVNFHKRIDDIPHMSLLFYNCLWVIVG
jgi:protein TIF31